MDFIFPLFSSLLCKNCIKKKAFDEVTQKCISNGYRYLGSTSGKLKRTLIECMEYSCKTKHYTSSTSVIDLDQKCRVKMHGENGYIFMIITHHIAITLTNKNEVITMIKNTSSVDVFDTLIGMLGLLVKWELLPKTISELSLCVHNDRMPPILVPCGSIKLMVHMLNNAGYNLKICNIKFEEVYRNSTFGVQYLFNPKTHDLVVSKLL